MTTESIQRHATNRRRAHHDIARSRSDAAHGAASLGRSKTRSDHRSRRHIHWQAIVPVTPAPTSEAALERNLAEEAGPGGRLCAHNLQDGYLRTLDDGVRIKEPWRVRAHLAQLRRGFIMFNMDGPPTVYDRGIAEDAPAFQRDELPHRDQSLWPISDFTGQPDEALKSQITFPVVTCDDAAEVFIYVARGAVAEGAVRTLLGAWRYHPKRKQGLIPIVGSAPVLITASASRPIGPSPSSRWWSGVRRTV